LSPLTGLPSPSPKSVTSLFVPSFPSPPPFPRTSPCQRFSRSLLVPFFFFFIILSPPHLRKYFTPAFGFFPVQELLAALSGAQAAALPYPPQPLLIFSFAVAINWLVSKLQSPTSHRFLYFNPPLVRGHFFPFNQTSFSSH